MLEKHTIL